MPLPEYPCCLPSLYSIIFVGFCKISYLRQVKANFRFSFKVEVTNATVDRLSTRYYSHTIC